MGLVARWYGHDLADGTALDATTAGPGDTPFDTATAGAAHVDVSGLHPPRIRLDQQPSSPAQLVWSAATLGALQSYAVRAYLQMSAWPSAGAPLAQAYGSGNTALRWRIDITVAGLLRLRDASNNVIATATTALPAGEELRPEIVIDGTDALVTVHAGDDESEPLVSLSGSVGNGADAIRFGSPNAAPTWPALYFAAPAVADTAAPIGARSHAASGTWTTDAALTAAPRVRHHATAMWEADTGWDATPHAHYASADWAIEAALAIDTGISPLYVQAGGEWRPADVREMTGGAWRLS
ncbi:hypothetical protein [Actinomadura violacea]|uniref:Uncharacterized protein n=1 Tax=Actinomadura violacea TaxID=2819934 RepID=A0ABS3RSW0_9ACTN|nr:hypothetical protein [Actinomadura violacea]MBO2459829.1 hypothetical protein [Actinomadura violacea]